MKISDERVLKQLVEHGFLATMRNYKYPIGVEVPIKYNGKIVTKAFVVGVLANRIAFRRAFLKYSGFESLEEWEEKAKEVFGRLPDYIILLFKYDIDLEQIEMDEFLFKKAIALGGS